MPRKFQSPFRLKNTASVKEGSPLAKHNRGSEIRKKRVAQKPGNRAQSSSVGKPDQVIENLIPGKDATLCTVQPCGALLARKHRNGTVLLYWRTTLQGKTVRENLGIYSATADRAWKVPAEDGRLSFEAALTKANAIALEHTQALPLGGLHGKRDHAKAQAERAEAERQAAEAARSQQTLGQLAMLYAEHLQGKGAKSANAVLNAIKQYVLPHPMAQEPAASLLDEQISELLRPIYGKRAINPALARDVGAEVRGAVYVAPSAIFQGSSAS